MTAFTHLLVALVAFGALLTLTAVQDWKTSSVSGELCLACWAAVFIVAHFVLKQPPVVLLIDLLLLIVFYFPADIPCFGDADIIPIAMGITTFCGTQIYVVSLVLLLVLMIPYAKIYAKAHNVEWYFGSRMFIPALPLFAAAWWVTTLAVLGVFIWTL